MDNYLKKIIHYFPPVNPNIENVLYEADMTYTAYKATSPLKPPAKGEIYSADILINLRTLRILLNSNITIERFISELNRLVEAWGPGGYYGKTILNSSLLDLISKINKEYEKQNELLKYAQDETLNYQTQKLVYDMSGISLKNKSSRNLNVKDLDFKNLGISS